MKTLAYIGPDSKRIGRPCCPHCKSMQLKRRDGGYFYCGRCQGTCDRPDKVVATGSKPAKRERMPAAGRPYYRGLHFPEQHEASY